jgi:SAM-dependent methyltransferase
VIAPDSLELKGLYTREYYLRGVAGHEAFRRGVDGIDHLQNVSRTHALAVALGPSLRRATDIGAGRGELAKHLVRQAVDVTLVDYSPAAIEIARAFVGENGSARFLTIPATEVAAHLAPASQDAVFMCDFVEHVSAAELRRVLHQCAGVLAPDGVLCIHTPERTSGAVLTNRAVEERHINLMDIAELREMLAEEFGYVDAYTWNGTQVFAEPGRCIDLFAVARMSRPARASLPRLPDGTYRRDGLALGHGFLLRCEAKPGGRSVRGRLRCLDAGGELLAEAPFQLDAHEGEPRVLQIASQLCAGFDLDTWAGVHRLGVELDDGSALASPPSVISGTVSSS